MKTAAVILCAGRGTRMNDDSLNKVCFDCAGVPVIRRIVEEMKAGGVECFAVVVGHRPSDVMDALSDTDGVVYAYQKEQKGTGHAALCGIRALKGVGYSGPVIVSMGDKIVDRSVIAELVRKSGGADVKAVWGVQHASDNPGGGRVLVADGEPCGVVELADGALMALAGLPEDGWKARLDEIGLNAKKAEKVMKAAKKGGIRGSTVLNGHEFTADDVLSSPYANAGLYCFDADAAEAAIGACGSDNAQGEIYLTDTLELFAQCGQAVLEVIDKSEQMLTYSTKPELAKMSRHFLRHASEVCVSENEEEKERYAELRERFISAFGDTGAILTRSPGRINLMGRHIDHRGGSVNVMAINYDTLMLVSPRDDDTVCAVNVSDEYPDGCFTISGELAAAEDYGSWLEYLEDGNVKARLEESRGSWINYIKAALLRFALEAGYPLCGMNIAVSGNIPSAAGLSSSSALVVAAGEAVNALNCMNAAKGRFIELCGEGEWFVGSRGGAGDHAAMKMSRRGMITRLGFKPFTLGEQVRFSDDYAVLVVNSMIRAKKSEGSRDRFNEKVASYEFALMLLRKEYPEANLAQFRDIAKIRPEAKIYEMLLSLPERITRKELTERLHTEDLSTLFSTHAEPEYYDLRGVALYGISECIRANKFMDILREGDYGALGEMIKVSHTGDSLTGLCVTDAYLKERIGANADLAKEYGAYGCSTAEIDALCALLDGTDGVLGASLVGAGLGGSVIALAERDKAEAVLSAVNEKYYDARGLERNAFVCVPSDGSGVVW